MLSLGAQNLSTFEKPREPTSLDALAGCVCSASNISDRYASTVLPLVISFLQRSFEKFKKGTRSRKNCRVPADRDT